MSKERLEEIMDAIAYLRDEYVDADTVSEYYGHDIKAEIVSCPISALSYTGDYIELLQKRVQELENIIYQDARQGMLESLYEENKKLREALEEIKKEEAVTTGLSNGQVAYTMSGHIARKALEESE